MHNMKEFRWLVIKIILKNLIFRKLLIKKIENFFGQTLRPKLMTIFEKFTKNMIFRKLLIKKIDHFFGKTAVHVSSPYSDEHLGVKTKEFSERLLRKAAE